MPLMGFKVVLTPDFEKTLGGARREIAAHQVDLVRPLAEMTRKEWQRKAPFDDRHHKPGTPHFRDTIETRVLAANDFGAVVSVSSPVWYGDLLEFGTSRMAAEPSLRPALDATKARAASVGEQIVAILRRAGGR